MKSNYAMQIPLFNLCNLNCKFCYQNSYGKRTNAIDLSYLDGLPKKIIDCHRELFIKRKTTDLYSTIYGGEPFNDALPKDIFDKYKKFCDEFSNLLYKEFNITNHYIWLTNGVTSRYKEIDDLLEYTKGNIYTSYDPCDRFSNEKQRETWYRTLIRYKDRMNMCTIVSTKANIDAIINEKDSTFLKIPSNIPMDISYYFPVSNEYKEFCPSDEELFSLYKYGLDKGIFNWLPISNLVRTIVDPDHVVRYCECLDTSFCFQNADKSITPLLTCYSTIEFAMNHNTDNYYKEEDYFKIKELPDEERRIIGAKRRGCLYCEFSNKCQKMCYMLVSHKDYKLSKECPFKRLYSYIEQNKDILDRYKDFFSRVKLNVTKGR